MLIPCASDKSVKCKYFRKDLKRCSFDFWKDIDKVAQIKPD